MFGRKRERLEDLAGKYRALTAEELLGCARAPLDHGLVKVAVHACRAQEAEAVAALASAGERGLSDAQVRELIGRLAAARRIEREFLATVQEANRRAV